MTITKINQLKKYLYNNHKKITDNGTNICDLFILDKDLESKKVFLTGENHGVKANVKLRMKFLKYFKEKIDFKYYLWELSYSTAYFLNMFLETGDTNILREVYSALEGTDAYNKDDYKHWKELYKYNRGLSIDRKIIVVGIDIEHQPINALKFMDYCLSQVTINNKCCGTEDNIEKTRRIIGSLVGELEKKRNSDTQINSREIRDFAYRIKKELENRGSIYKKILGQYYFPFKLVNQNIINMYDVYEGNNFNGIRDKKMYENFIEIYNQLPKDKYFGQLGLSHVFQKPFPYVNWLGAALNENSQFKGKILSIVYVYKDCKYLYPTLRKNYISSINTLDPSMDIFGDFVKSKCTIFRLNGKNSPFKDNLIWPVSHKFPREGATTDYFQYLLVIKDSKATGALNLKNSPPWF